MFSVLILARNHDYLKIIQELIDWPANGFSRIAAHIREEAAYAVLRTNAPDLLVIDAQAPCMSQLNFLYKAREILPHARIIILTAEKDFDIAQAAFDLRVDALLIWSELDSDILSSRIQRIHKELDESIHRRGIVKRQLFRDILKGKIPTPGEIERYFEINVAHPKFIMIRINRDAPFSIVGNEIVPVIGYYAVNWHSCDFPSEFSYIATVNTFMHSWCSLFQIRNTVSAAQIHYLTHAAAVMLQNTFKRQYQDTVSLAYSQPFSDFNDVVGIVNQLDHCLSLQRYYGRAQINTPSDFPAVQPLNENRLNIQLEQLSGALLGEQPADAIKLISQIFSCMKHDMVSPACLSTVCARILDIMRAYCQKRHIMASYHELIQAQITTNSCYTLDDIILWFCQAIPYLTQRRPAGLQSSQSQKVQSIIDYIEQNYASNETIPALAAKLHISSDYLRHLFKEETGQTISGFITNVKIEQAKKLLTSGRYKINEVAKLAGFSSTQYFGTVFRKQSGMTPREYIAQHAFTE